jgi:lecithin-cholesterol acyltransferase
MNRKYVWLINMVVVLTLLAAVPGKATDEPVTPVVLFPGWVTTKLEVQVSGQTAFPECPASGSFGWWPFNENGYNGFSQVCVDKLMTLVVDPDRNKPMPERISNQPGVTVSIKDYGLTESVLSMTYEPMFTFLEAAGYVRNISIRVAGYDSRLSPDLGGFLERSIALIEETYHDNGNIPVHLVAHSQGNVHAQYLLTHTSQAWKNQFIHGFTAIGGNWPGDNEYQLLFTGFNVIDFSVPTDPENAASSAAMYQTWPLIYSVAPDPLFYKKEVVVIGIQGGRQYIAQHYRQLFWDAGMPLSRELADYYIGLVKFATPPYFPNVDIYAEIGTGIPAMIGVELKELKVGTWDDNVTNVFLRDGDGVEVDIANESIFAWENMRCYHFELNENPGVHHYSLPADSGVLNRLFTHLQQPRSACPSSVVQTLASFER